MIGMETTNIVANQSTANVSIMEVLLCASDKHCQAEHARELIALNYLGLQNEAPNFIYMIFDLKGT